MSFSTSVRSGSRKISTFQNLLLLLIIFVTIVYALTLLKTPLLSAGDVLHYSWIAQQIVNFGEIPTQNPINGYFDVLALAPLFQIIGAQMSLLSGLEVIYIYVALNFLTFTLYSLGLALVAKKILKNDLIAFLTPLFFFTLNGPPAYIFKHTAFFEIKQASFGIFIILCTIALVVEILQTKEKVSIYKFLMFYFLITGIILLHQFSAFALMSVILTSCIIALLFFPQHRKHAIIMTGIIIVSIAAVTVLNLQLLYINDGGYLKTAHAFAKDYTLDSVSLSPSVNNNFFKDLFRNAYHPLLILFGTIGSAITLLFLKKNWNAQPIGMIILLVWFVSYMFYIFQPLGSYQLLPDRFLHWSILPLSLLAAYGLERCVAFLKNNKIILSISLSLILIISLRAITVNAQSFFTSENISINELKSFVQLRHFFDQDPNVLILADPILGYKLLTLSDITLTYKFERTNLYRDYTLTYDVVKNFIFADPENAYKYAVNSKAKYIILDYFAMKHYYKDADFKKLSDKKRYKKLFSRFENAEDTIIVYEILRQDK